MERGLMSLKNQAEVDFNRKAEIIVEEVCRAYKLTHEEITAVNEKTGKIDRTEIFVDARHTCYYLAKEKFLHEVPLKRIPHTLFGITQDHSTIIHAKHKIESMCEAYEIINKFILDLVKRIRQRIEIELYSYTNIPQL